MGSDNFEHSTPATNSGQEQRRKPAHLPQSCFVDSFGDSFSGIDIDPEFAPQQSFSDGGQILNHSDSHPATRFATVGDAIYGPFPTLHGVMSPGQFTSPLADNGYSASDQGHFQPSHSASAFDSARNLTHPPQVDNVSSATSYIHHQPRTHSALQRPSSNPDHYYQQPQELKLPGNDPRNPYVQDSTNLATQAFGQPIIPSPSSAPSSIFNETTIPSSSESWTSEQDSLVREWKKKHKTHEEISAELRRRFGVRKNSNMISKRYAKLRDKSVSKDLLEQVLTKLAPLFSSIVDDELSKVGLGLGLGLGLGREPAGDRDEQAITAAAYQEASRIMKMRGALHKHVQSCVLEGAGTDEPAIQSSERS